MTLPRLRTSPGAPLAQVLAFCLIASPTLLGCPTPPPRAAAPPPSPSRLAGDWEVTSTLSLQEGADTLQGHLLSISGRFARILDGQIELPGLPPFIAGLAAPFVQQLARQHVPAWARELLAKLGKIHETLTDARVEAIHTLRPRGGFQYEGHSRITRVTLQTPQGNVSADAARIPGLGALSPEPYAASERDGILRIAAHPIRLRHAQLLRWALDALVAALTCKTPGVPCLSTFRAAADHLLDCGPLTRKLLSLAPALRAASPLVLAACEIQKKQLLADADAALDKVALSLTYLELSGEARVGRDGNHFAEGRWFGRLGKAYGGGRFRGAFTGRRAHP